MSKTSPDAAATKPLEPTSPLGEFLRSLRTLEAKEEFAKDCGDKLLYLYQVAAKAEPNPTLKRAMAIRNASMKWAKLLDVRPLTYEDLLIGKPKQ